MLKVAPPLKHLSDIEITKAIRDGLAYVDNDTIVPFIAGGAGFHNSDGSRFNAPDFNSTANLSITCGNGVKGSYTQVLAAANNQGDCDNLLVLLNWISSTSTALVDIAIGAAASEVVVAADLMAQATGISGPIPYQYLLPIAIPGGTRIAARGLAQAASKSVGVTVWPISASYLGILELSRVTAYGAGVAAASRGTSVAASASANVKGSWTQLTASSTNDMKAIIIAVGAAATSRGTIDNRLDIGVGAGGSEVVVIPDLYIGSFATSTMFLPVTYGPFPIDIPAGTRIAARLQSGTGSTAMDVAVYGLD